MHHAAVRHSTPAADTDSPVPTFRPYFVNLAQKVVEKLFDTHMCHAAVRHSAPAADTDSPVPTFRPYFANLAQRVLRSSLTLTCVTPPSDRFLQMFAAMPDVAGFDAFRRPTRQMAPSDSTIRRRPIRHPGPSDTHIPPSDSPRPTRHLSIQIYPTVGGKNTLQTSSHNLEMYYMCISSY